MLPDFAASHSFPSKPTKSHLGDRIVPAVRQPPLPDGGTIDPSLLMCGNYEPLSWENTDSISPYTSGSSRHQRTSPVPAISTEVWMGYSDGAVPEFSHTSPTSDNRDAAYVTLTKSCLCGCDRGGCIPQREFERSSTDPLSPVELQEIIRFSVNGVCGYPLKDALRKQYTGLDGRDDKMFVDCKSSISIRLEWLPYKKWTKQIRTLTWGKDRDHITRAKLATGVAKKMDDFFKEMQGKDPDPTYWEYRVQPGIIDLNHLELVALKRVSKASWMPHFRLVDPSRSIRCPSPTTYSHAQEHVSPSHREPNVSQVDITEGSGVHERSSALGPANPAERATTEEQSPIPRPVQPAEEAAKGPTPVSLRVGSRDTKLVDSCICGCGGGACVPQRIDTRHVPRETISFNVNGKCGYPLVDALREQYTGLDGKGDKMFADCKSHISLSFEWLPYEKWTGKVLTMTGREEPDHISRAMLATEVAKWMRAFFEEMKGKEADPSHLEYRVQPGVIDPDHLELVALERISKSSWMPHFRLIPPRLLGPVYHENSRNGD